jgi:hypothetical protein
MQIISLFPEDLFCSDRPEYARVLGRAMQEGGALWTISGERRRRV